MLKKNPIFVSRRANYAPLQQHQMSISAGCKLRCGPVSPMGSMCCAWTLIWVTSHNPHVTHIYQTSVSTRALFTPNLYWGIITVTERSLCAIRNRERIGFVAVHLRVCPSCLQPRNSARAFMSINLVKRAFIRTDALEVHMGHQAAETARARMVANLSVLVSVQI